MLVKNQNVQDQRGERLHCTYLYLLIQNYLNCSPTKNNFHTTQNEAIIVSSQGCCINEVREHM